MTFDLFPHLGALYAYLALVAVAAIVGVTLLAAVSTGVLTAHRRERVARHQSIPTYYRQIALSP